MQMEQFESLTTTSIPQLSNMQNILSLEGKAAIVTGGACGLGYNVVNRFCEAGAKVVIADNNERLSQKAVGEFKDRGYDVAYAKVDVKNVEEIYRAVDFAAEACGRIDILVNNAALQHHSTFLDMSEEFYDNMLDTNLKGTYFFGQAVARYMVKNGIKGKIINIASDAAASVDVPTGTLSHYTAAKSGVVELTKAMARELHQYDILVNCVAPGGMNTIGGISAAMAAEGAYPGIMQKFNFNPPHPVSKTPDEVAVMIYLMATSASDFMVGETIFVDGGARLALVQERFSKFPG